MSAHGWDWNATSGPPPCAWETGKDAEKYNLTITWLDHTYRSGTSVGASELEAPVPIRELEALAINDGAPFIAGAGQTFELIGRAEDTPAIGWDVAPTRSEPVDTFIWKGVKTFTVPALGECPPPRPEDAQRQRGGGSGSGGRYRGRGYRGRGRGWGGGRGRGGGGGGGGGYQPQQNAEPQPISPQKPPMTAEERRRRAEADQYAWENTYSWGEPKPPPRGW